MMSLFSFVRVNTPLLACETAIVVVTPLSIFLGGSEEFFGFVRILLHN